MTSPMPSRAKCLKCGHAEHYSKGQNADGTCIYLLDIFGQGERECGCRCEFYDNIKAAAEEIVILSAALFKHGHVISVSDAERIIRFSCAEWNAPTAERVSSEEDNRND